MSPELEDLFARLENDPKDTERYNPDPVLLMTDPHVRALAYQRVSAKFAADYHARRCADLIKRMENMALTYAGPFIFKPDPK